MYAGTNIELYNQYYPNFVNIYFNGTTGTALEQFGSFVQTRYDILNVTLRTIDSINDIPVMPTNGTYDITLQLLEIYSVIYNKIWMENIGNYSEEPYWIKRYNELYMSLLNNLASGKIFLIDDVSYSDVGFDKALPDSSNIGSAIFHNNWQDGVFLGQYPFKYKVMITEGSTYNTAKFNVSYNNGIDNTIINASVGTSFISIGYGCNIRWELKGTTGQFAVNDNWTFDAVPNMAYVKHSTRKAVSHKQKIY